MIPERIEEAVRTVVYWVRRYSDDWSIIKREIMGELDNDHRTFFSKRDKITKELPSLNTMELEIIELWKQLTGVSLIQRPLAERRGISWFNHEKAEKNKKRNGRRPAKRNNAGW